MTTHIIGVDCATQAVNVGLAHGVFVDGKLKIVAVDIGSKSVALVDTILSWLSEAKDALIALDAPLGWPQDLGDELSIHIAGQPLNGEPNQLFRRRTDKFIKDAICKTPLDVGADRIARTAHAALALLDEIRIKTDEGIPLALLSGLLTGISAIEVYPAASLIAHGIQASGYKRKEGQAARRALVRELATHMEMPKDTALLESNDDALDAVICCLAGADFLRGDVMPPDDLQIAQKEGWIWVKRPSG